MSAVFNIMYKDEGKKRSEYISYIKSNFKFLSQDHYRQLVQITIRESFEAVTDHDDGIRIDLDKLSLDVLIQLKVFIENNI